MRGDGGREYFCMLYEARRHMPSELGCLLSQGSQFDRPELAPSKDTPLIPNSHPPSYAPTTGLAIILVVYGLSPAQFCMGVYWKCRGGGVPSDLNTSDIVVSPGRNSWSAGERGWRRQG